jgi:hypothetical protein
MLDTLDFDLCNSSSRLLGKSEGDGDNGQEYGGYWDYAAKNHFQSLFLDVPVRP